MSLLIKVCGLSSPETLEVALDSGADMVGFVFFPPSPRNVEMDAARMLGERVRGRALKVALSVDATDAQLEASITALKPDMLQLHGQETPERLIGVRRKFGMPVMKALPVAQRDDLAAIRIYEGVADRLLFDARPPREATRPGGLGKTFDWRLLRGLHIRLPYMLSGGLDPENVGQALRLTDAPGIDVSSGVECSPGIKDPDKIRRFVAAARKAAECAEQKLRAAPA